MCMCMCACACARVQDLSEFEAQTGAAYGSGFDMGGCSEQPKKKAKVDPKPLNIGGSRGGPGGRKKDRTDKIIEFMRVQREQEKADEEAREAAKEKAAKEERDAQRAHDLAMIKLLTGAA